MSYTVTSNGITLELRRTWRRYLLILSLLANARSVFGADRHWYSGCCRAELEWFVLPMHFVRFSLNL